MSKFHYKILELPENATHEQIKQQYKKLSLKWHPDKNLDDVENATKMFNLISEAFQVLGHRQRRQEYDNQIQPNKPYKLYGGMDIFSKMFPNQRNVRSDLNNFHNNPLSIFNNIGSLFESSFNHMNTNMNIPNSSSGMVYSSSTSSSLDKDGKRNIQSKSVKQYVKDGIKYTEETTTQPNGKPITKKYQEKINNQPTIRQTRSNPRAIQSKDKKQPPHQQQKTPLRRQ